MSEPTGTYHSPGQGPLPGQPGYGEPIAYQGPPPMPAAAPQYGQYGQYGQPQQFQQYGPPQYGPPQYGPQQYGPPQYNYGGYGPPVPQPSGATVITAAVVQIVQSALFVLAGLAILLLADVVNSAGDEFDTRAGTDVSGTTDSISRLVAVIGVALLIAAIFMIVLAAMAIRGRRWAAVTSVVLQGLTAVLSLIGLARSDTGDAPGAGIVFLLASIAVVVLFLLPSSNAYFAAKSAAPHYR